ncbi:MAG: DNA-3-methyladenine glycosylase [Bacteroidota bacterium]|nr:DNA-3-methyladenine glycosylase [Bacteroidota bacterium]
MKTGSFTEPMGETGRLGRDFYTRDVLEVAPELLGKALAIRLQKGDIHKFIITDTEAYRGEEDRACHASRGRTPRTEIMFHGGGRLYVYFVYGMYWMLNIVTAGENDPQAVLIRGVENYPGPGKVTKALGIDRSFYGEDLVTSDRIWIEDNGIVPVFKSGPRIGIDYAGEIWKNKPWRYFTLQLPVDRPGRERGI